MQPDYAYTFAQHGDDGRDDALLWRVQAKLWRHYPGWAWYVEIPPAQNIIVIKNFDLGGNLNKPWGFVIHKNTLGSDMKMVVRGGGELLERYNRRRGRVTAADLNDPKLPWQKPEA